MAFPDGSVGNESACKVGNPGSIPGSGRSAGERIGYPLQYLAGEFHGLYSPWGRKQTRLSNFRFHSALQINHIYPGVRQPTRAACRKQFRPSSPGQDNAIELAKGIVLSLPGLCEPIWTRETHKTLLEPNQNFASLRVEKASLFASSFLGFKDFILKD